MVNNLDLTTLISQIPDAQKLQHPQMIAPEAQQVLAQALVQKKRRREQKQVAKSENSAARNQVHPDGNAHEGGFFGAFREKNDPAQTAEPSDPGRLLDIQA